MQEILNQYFPNVMSKLPDFYLSIRQTIVMVAWSGVIALIIGVVLGILLVVTRDGGLMENKAVFQLWDKLINLFRSIPFIILLTGVMPLTRIIMGSAIGVKGAIVPLIFGTVPFFSRQMESALSEVSPGLVEAAQSIGNSKFEIIVNVYLKESIPQISRAVSITTISLIGLTAMAGVVGAGGLGDFAVRYGHDRNQTDVTYATIIVLVIMVSVIQLAGNYIARKNTH
ncbi:D-methionine transport system permease protein [Anaerocolumna jejuensis DSM 15929]|uniref:D-methionine transport system permease protein n=1 Tax=Anaerocolumna jejuensis DSM 15929 TaxID=1121322 RepID=A0A1M6WZG0_9FIRM|nr:methionine ABC transporter permease [Anaerocolumna jejuensis]SHK98959.1 D-methionine transport system permease protein [Anaerocolumna jejuensis DSM 15929]